MLGAPVGIIGITLGIGATLGETGTAFVWSIKVEGTIFGGTVFNKVVGTRFC